MYTALTAHLDRLAAHTMMTRDREFDGAPSGAHPPPEPAVPDPHDVDPSLLREAAESLELHAAGATTVQEFLRAAMAAFLRHRAGHVRSRDQGATRLTAEDLAAVDVPVAAVCAGGQCDPRAIPGTVMAVDWEVMAMARGPKRRRDPTPTDEDDGV